jgi:cytoskeletal protein CcmA (bactofilin family)
MFSGSLEIEGAVRGDVVAQVGDENAQVRIQNSGEVTGEVRAPVIVINSSIRGNVFSSQRVELAAQAVVHGDIHYQVIEMAKGAQINGNLVYTGAVSASDATAGAVADGSLGAELSRDDRVKVEAS